MSVFDPPELKEKPYKRPSFVYPEGINRGMFALLYFGSIVFWVVLVVGFVVLILFVLLPLFEVSVPVLYRMIILVFFGGVSGIFGMVIGSAIVNGVIAQGIKAGDIKINQ